MLKRLMTISAVVSVMFVVPAAAQDGSGLSVSDAEEFMGEWNVTMPTPQGETTVTLALEDLDGKVVGKVTSEVAGEVVVSDISKSGDNLILKYVADMQGQPLPVSATLTLVGDDISVSFDFAGQFTVEGKGSRP